MFAHPGLKPCRRPWAIRLSRMITETVTSLNAFERSEGTLYLWCQLFRARDATTRNARLIANVTPGPLSGARHDPWTRPANTCLRRHPCWTPVLTGRIYRAAPTNEPHVTRSLDSSVISYVRRLRSENETYWRSSECTTHDVVAASHWVQCGIAQTAETTPPPQGLMRSWRRRCQRSS